MSRPLRARGAVLPLAFLLACAAFLTLVGPAKALPLKDRVVLSIGHTDLIDALYEDGRLFAKVHDDTVSPSVSRPIDEVLAQVKPGAEIEVPAAPEWEFIGPGGSSAWILPQTQDPNLLWPGWRTTSLPAGTFAGEIKWRLLSVDGPGRVTLFGNGSFGEPNVIFNSAAGFPATSWMFENSHTHANWTFGAEGVYRLIFSIEGTRPDGTVAVSPPLEYRFFVGDLGDLPDATTTELSITGARSNYQVGEEVLLATAQSSDTGLSDYRWSRRCGDEAEFEAAGTGAALWFPARKADDGCRYKVALYDEAGELVDESDPVTIRVGRLVLSIGHTDAVAPQYEDGRLSLKVQDETETVGEGDYLRDPADVIFHAKPESEAESPADMGAEWDFLGAAGRPLWLLPMTQNPEVLWPGFSSESIDAGVLEGDALDWHLENIEGPGRVNMWEEDPVGRPLTLFRGAEALPQTQPMAVGAHRHFNWAFGAEGLYTLTFEATAHRASDGSQVRSGPILYRFYAGALARMQEVPYAKVAVDGMAASYRRAEEIHLSASQSPDLGLHDYRWSRRCGEALALTPIGSGASLDLVAGPNDEGCEYFVSLRDGDGTPVAISAGARLELRGADDRPGPDPKPEEIVPTAGEPSAPPSGPATVTRPRLRLSGGKLRGRRLTVWVGLDRPTRIAIVIRRAGKVVAKARPRVVSSSSRKATFRLDRKLPRGRYRVILRMRAGTVVQEKGVGLWAG